MKKILVLLSIIITVLNISNQNAQWTQSNLNSNVQVSSIACDGARVYAGTYGNGLFISTNNGVNWTQHYLNTIPISSIVINGSDVYAGASVGGVYKSTNNGVNWVQTSLNNRQVYQLYINGNNIYAGVQSLGVYISSNGGQSWQQTSLNNKTVFTLSGNSSNVFAGATGSVYRTTNNGLNWNQITLSETIISLVMSGVNLFAGSDYGHGIYLSSDNGVTWAPTFFSYNLYLWTLAAAGPNIFVGTVYNGVYLTTNNGLNWIQKNEGMGEKQIMALGISSSYIFAGTGDASGIIYRRSLSEIFGIKKISSQVPSHFSLSQNYPNPFNPTTMIKFNIPLSRGVDAAGGRGVSTRLLVYDLTGREVAALVNESLQPGTYEVEFDGSNFASGVYFYKLTSKDFNQTKRMVLIK